MPLIVRLFHYPKCSTCRKAIAFVRAHAPDAELILSDLVASPPSRVDLEALVSRSALPLKRWFNTSGESYRNGQFGVRLPAMTDAEQLDALAADGKLIKRPVVIIRAGGQGELLPGSSVLVGFDEPAWSGALRAEP